jgi:hypothetical protein
LITFSFAGYALKIIPLADLRKNATIYMVATTERLREARISGEPNDIPVMVPFKELAPMTDGVFVFGATLVDNKIYVIGGDRSRLDTYYDFLEHESNIGKLQIYDIETDTWSLSKQKFSSRAYRNIHYYNGKIFVIGGKRFGKNKKVEFLNDAVEVYDLQKDTIVSSNTNPRQAVNFASALYKNSIIVMGGSIKRKKHAEQNLIAKVCSNQIHLFDLEAGYWYDLGNMPYHTKLKVLLQIVLCISQVVPTNDVSLTLTLITLIQESTDSKLDYHST